MVELEKYKRLVSKLAWRYVRRLPDYSILDHDDLAQEGWTVLVKAQRSYKPELGLTFMTYIYTALTRKFSLLVRNEWKDINISVHVPRQVHEDGDVHDPLETIGAEAPPQGYVDVLHDLERGYGYGMRGNSPRRAAEARVEIRRRAAALV